MKTVGKIVAILYTIPFTIILLALILVLTLSGYLKGSFYTNLITSDAFMDTKIKSLSLYFDDMEEIREICGSDDCTVKEAIINSASEELEIDKALIEEALDDKDIQKAIGDLVGIYTSFETTGTSPKLDYKIYEKTLNKEISQKILKQLNLTTEDIKEIIKLYNEQIDNNYKGGVLSEQQSISIY